MNSHFTARFHCGFVFFFLLCLLSTPKAGAQNIVQNPDFNIVSYVPLSIAPWTTTAITSTSPSPPGGTTAAVLGTVSQTLTTTPGQEYELTFYAAGDLYESQTSTFEVAWAGTTVATFTTQSHDFDGNQGDVYWQQFSAPLLASSSSTPITFLAVDNTIVDLYDVQVEAVPEPSSLQMLLATTLGWCLSTMFSRHKGTENS